MTKVRKLHLYLISCLGLVQGPEVMTDKYATAEAYYGLARAYSNVPDLHIMWLLYLCEVHQHNQSYAEAAQCAVAVAGVIMQVFVLVNCYLVLLSLPCSDLFRVSI
jgi:hypothetical protein